MYNDYTLLTLHHQRVAECTRLYEQHAQRVSLASPHAGRRVAQAVGSGCVGLGERLLAYGRDGRGTSLPIRHVR